jgi:hypothetical protein
MPLGLPFPSPVLSSPPPPRPSAPLSFELPHPQRPPGDRSGALGRPVVPRRCQWMRPQSSCLPAATPSAYWPTWLLGCGRGSRGWRGWRGVGGVGRGQAAKHRAEHVEWGGCQLAAPVATASTEPAPDVPTVGGMDAELVAHAAAGLAAASAQYPQFILGRVAVYFCYTAAAQYTVAAAGWWTPGAVGGPHACGVDGKGGWIWAVAVGVRPACVCHVDGF